MTEEEKAAQKAKPVATTPIPGTPWYVLGSVSELLYFILVCLFIAVFDCYMVYHIRKKRCFKKIHAK